MMDDIEGQLQEADEELQAELDKWGASQLNPQGWRMGDAELLIRCEILTLMHFVMERLEVTQREMDVILKRKLKEQLEAMYPEVNKMRRDAIRQGITQGVNPFFKPNHN